MEPPSIKCAKTVGMNSSQTHSFRPSSGPGTQNVTCDQKQRCKTRPYGHPETGKGSNSGFCLVIRYTHTPENVRVRVL